MTFFKCIVKVASPTLVVVNAFQQLTGLHRMIASLFPVILIGPLVLGLKLMLDPLKGGLYLHNKTKFIIANNGFTTNSVCNIIDSVDETSIIQILLFGAMLAIIKVLKDEIFLVFKDLGIIRWFKKLIGKDEYEGKWASHKISEILAILKQAGVIQISWEIHTEQVNKQYIRWRGIGGNLHISTLLFDQSPSNLAQEVDYYTHIESIPLNTYALIFISVVSFFISDALIHASLWQWLVISIVIFRFFSITTMLSIMHSDLVYVKAHGFNRWNLFVDRTVNRRYIYGSAVNTEGFLYYLISFPFCLTPSTRKNLIHALMQGPEFAKIKMR